MRVADDELGGGAYFGDAPASLAAASTTAQNAAAPSPPWHAWVASQGVNDAKLFAGAAPLRTANAAATTAAGPLDGGTSVDIELWQVQRGNGDQLTFQAPGRPGKYVLSILKISDNGDVGAASATIVVK